MSNTREQMIEVIVSKLDDKEDWVDVSGIADALLERFDVVEKGEYVLTQYDIWRLKGWLSSGDRKPFRGTCAREEGKE